MIGLEFKKDPYHCKVRNGPAADRVVDLLYLDYSHVFLSAMEEMVKALTVAAKQEMERNKYI